MIRKREPRESVLSEQLDDEDDDLLKIFIYEMKSE